MGSAPARGRAPVAAMLAGAALLCFALLSFVALPSLLDVRMECRMSRMLPSYVVHDEELREFTRNDSPLMHKYSLKEYREADRMRHKMDNRHATPVLFIPGNAGSFAQVRSLASSASHQYWDELGNPRSEYEDAPGPTVWYSIDFNEDFSAFHGNTLKDQAYYVNEVLRFLRLKYPAPDDGKLRSDEHNTTVALVGHSMGGIVARLALTLPNHPAASVDTIVTLSTPHAFPPVPFERSLESVYSRVNKAANEPGAPLVISLAGGVLDTQLSSDASSLTLAQLYSPLTRVSAFTGAVSTLWSAVDHLAVVWCDQLRFKIAKGLLLDYKQYGAITEPRSTPLISAARHELWRRLLGITLDGASLEEEKVTIKGASDHFDGAELEEHNYTNEEGTRERLEDKEGRVTFWRPIAPPGRLAGTGMDERVGFELVTNYAVGESFSTGHIVPQEEEMQVELCKNRIRFESGQFERVQCRKVLPGAYERLPASPPPEDSLAFPNRSTYYDMPRHSFSRVHFSPDYLAAFGIDWIRVWIRSDEPKHAIAPHRQLVLQMGWVENAPIELRGKPGWFSKTWELPGRNMSLHPPATAQEEHAPTWTWHLPDIDSSLLAYDLELTPAACFARKLAPPPLTAPILRAMSLSTNDARIYPSLHMSRPVRVPLSLHGAAPFLPPPEGKRGTLLQLWALDTYRHSEFADVFNSECPLPYERLRLRVNVRASAALLVLRYRLALLAWPIAVLAYALVRAPPASTPVAAVLDLMELRALAVLLGAPIALHVFAAMGHSLGLATHVLGIGISTLRFVWLGPALMLVAYTLTAILVLLTDLALHATHTAMLRFLPHYVSRLQQPTWRSLSAWKAWAKRPATWITVAVLMGLIFLLPYQIILIVCTIVHMFTTARSYMAWQNASAHAPSTDRTVSSLARQHHEQVWLLQFLLWMLPLYMPILAVWVRNVNAGFHVTLSRTEHNVVATVPLLVLIYMMMHGVEGGLPGLYTEISVGVYTLQFLAAMTYGIRYTFSLYEVFVVAVTWEVVQRLIRLYRPPQRGGEISLEEHALFSLDDDDDEEIGHKDPVAAHLTVPASLAAPAPALSGAADASKLDALLAEYLDTVETYVATRDRLSSMLGAGHAQLTRAKMALDGGAFGQRLSRDAYDERMRARAAVTEDRLLWTADPDQPGEAADEKQAAAALEQTPPAAGLRRRTPARDATTAEKEGSMPTECSSTPSDVPRTPQGFDPLFQFSGLPPMSLRTAQRHFQDALALLLDPAARPPTAGDTAVWQLQRRLAALEADIAAARHSTTPAECR